VRVRPHLEEHEEDVQQEEDDGDAVGHVEQVAFLLVERVLGAGAAECKVEGGLVGVSDGEQQSIRFYLRARERQ
jgi:hypothetical protein